MTISNGKKFEYRMRRLLYHEGYLTRSGIDLRAYFYPEKVDITDLDVLGLNFSVPGRIASIVVDCKSGDAKAPERILWLRGLCEYLGADQGLVAKSKLTTRVKEFARAVGLQAFDEPRIAERETELGVRSDEWHGSHNPEFWEEIQRIAQVEFNENRQDPLRRFYRFITAEFWYEDNYIRLKKLCSGLATLSERWVERVDSPRVKLYRWLLAESIILFTVCLMYIARDVHGLREQEAVEAIRVKMAAGAAKYEDLERIARRVTEYVHTLVTETQGAEATLTLPSFMPEPPRYTGGVVDLVMRLRARPTIAASLPRFQDFALYEFGLLGQPFDRVLLHRHGFLDVAILLKQTSNITRFMQRYLRLRVDQLQQIWPFIETGQSLGINVTVRPIQQNLAQTKAGKADNPHEQGTPQQSVLDLEHQTATEHSVIAEEGVSNTVERQDSDSSGETEPGSEQA